MSKVFRDLPFRLLALLSVLAPYSPPELANFLQALVSVVRTANPDSLLPKSCSRKDILGWAACIP